LLKIAPPSQRVAWVAAHTAAVGAVATVAPIVGSMTLKVAMARGLGGYEAYVFLFSVSSVLRLSALFLLRGVPEVGAVTLERTTRILHRAMPRWTSPAGFAVF